jgi:hypothetical protein
MVSWIAASGRYAWPVAIFGRKTARQRLRRAARESLSIPAFSSPIDCTPWVLGGLWPAELATITPENAAAAEHLKMDLQSIVQSANEGLMGIRRAVMPDAVRHDEESRVVGTARGFAVRRVESAVRHLHAVARSNPAQLPHPEAPEPPNAPAGPVQESRGDAQNDRHTAPPDPARAAETAGRTGPQPEPDRKATELLTQRATAELNLADAVGRLAAQDPVATQTADTDAAPATEVIRVATVMNVEPAAHPAETAAASIFDPAAETERLWRLLKFVARQEPGLRWAAGRHEDGTTVLVTDVAHGWVPPGITLPAGVRLLAPDRRSGTAISLLGATVLTVQYAPGDPLGWATNSATTEASPLPRDLPAVDDLGWVLSEATHWRDGLPRLAHTLAKAGAAGTGVVEAEVDVLRVHLDTARYQLLAQYPDVDAALLLNCLLLAATEGIATGDRLAANYHFAWFQRLDTPPQSKWADEI